MGAPFFVREVREVKEFKELREEADCAYQLVISN
jgi:hypothetical protein